MNIEEIRIVDEFNIRADQLSQAKIAEYAENYDRLPPVSVFKVDGEFYLVDGWHRINAAQKLEKMIVCVDVVGEGTMTDAKDFADFANVAHGIMLTREQKQAIAFRVINRHPEWSLREVADKIKVHHSTISEWKKQLESVGNPTVDHCEDKKPDLNRASQEDRAGSVDVLTVFAKFKQWKKCVTTNPQKWPEERKIYIRGVLQPIIDFYNLIQPSCNSQSK